MALDGAFLSCLREELIGELVGGRVDKIHQPGREELILTIRGGGGTARLYISARGNSPRIHLTGESLENPAEPPMFCMLLRKKLSGGRLAGIRQEGLERVLWLDFDCLNEFGDPVRLTLAAEIIGRHSNIILTGPDGVVIDSIKRIDWESSPVRPVLPGLPYSPPPRDAAKLDLTAVSPEQAADAVLAARSAPLDRALLAAVHGLSPAICREIAHLTARGRELTNTELGEQETARLRSGLARIKAAVETGQHRVPYLLTDRLGAPLEFSFLPLTQYGLSATGREQDSFSALLDKFYAERDAAERLKQRGQDLSRLLANLSERTARKLENRRADLAQSGKREEKRIFADLITANAYAIPKGASSAELINYFDPDCAPIRVPLDPALSAAANAQKYYKDYRRAQTAERVLAEQIVAAEAEAAYIDSVADALSRAGGSRELDELRTELAGAGYLRLPGGKKNKRKPPPLGPLTFRSDDGFTILVGRSNLCNDRLTLKTAKGSDIWLHVKNIPGSHVVIAANGEAPPDRTIEQAAILAATYSKAAGSARVPVDYTHIRHVRKPQAAKPGAVIYDNHKTAYVVPDKALAARLVDSE
ncbi:MAG: NFACT family protein [Oscillospiraceae bacterium]|nr:NFACT family protein [Oscillospiraceae bacterium]